MTCGKDMITLIFDLRLTLHLFIEGAINSQADNHVCVRVEFAHL